MEIVRPTIDELTLEMNRLDDRVPRKLEGHAQVGSYYTGLKTKEADEFDFSVPIQGDFSQTEVSREKRMFKFERNDIEEKFDLFLPDNVQIISSTRPLSEPGQGFMAIRDARLATEWVRREGQPLMYSEFIIPYFVKLWFKKLLKQAIDNLELRNKRGKILDRNYLERRT